MQLDDQWGSRSRKTNELFRQRFGPAIVFALQERLDSARILFVLPFSNSKNLSGTVALFIPKIIRAEGKSALSELMGLIKSV
jgi:hypothetical protein